MEETLQPEWKTDPAGMSRAAPESGAAPGSGTGAEATGAEETVSETIAGLPERTRRAERRASTSLLNYPATYLLIGLNVAVFAVMFGFGPVPELLHQGQWGQVLTASFDVGTLKRFGATNVGLIEQGQWWRLVTGTFVHVTVLHIVLNMWCLWNLGLFGEPLLGRRGLVAVYVLTGSAGMMLSYALNSFAGVDVTVAGASGAVFGLAGILIVLLSNRRLNVPWAELRSLRRQVIFFAVANLAIGLAPGMLGMVGSAQLSQLHVNPEVLPHIDNSAHIGGFVLGLGLGWPLFSQMTEGRARYRARQTRTFAGAALLLSLVGYALAQARRG